MGSIHRRRSSIDEASSFFEKVQLHFQLADLLVELVLVGVGLLAHLLAAVAEDSGKPAIACFFQPPTWVGWTPKIWAIRAVVLWALMASTATLAFRLGG